MFSRRWYVMLRRGFHSRIGPYTSSGFYCLFLGGVPRSVSLVLWMSRSPSKVPLTHPGRTYKRFCFQSLMILGSRPRWQMKLGAQFSGTGPHPIS